MRKTVLVVSSVIALGVLTVGCPDLLESCLTVSSHCHHFGPGENTWTFQVWNERMWAQPLNFNVDFDKAWILVTPDSGISNGPNDKVPVTVTIDRHFPNPAPDKGMPAFLKGLLTVSSSAGKQLIEVTTAPDYLTENFTTAPDLVNKTVTFVPDGSVNWYCATTTAAEGFPTDPAEGQIIDYGINDPLVVIPSRAVSLYGVVYDTIFVSSYGYLTFGQGGDLLSLVNETLAQHFAVPRVSLLSTVDGGAGGTVSAKEDADKIAITFQDVPVTHGRAEGLSNAQVELFFNGTIRMTWLNLSVPDAVIGLSYGPTAPVGGIPADFVNSDLSTYAGPCTATTIF